MRRVLHEVGKALRETGQMLDRTGMNTVNNMAYLDPLSRHRAVMALYDQSPALAADAWVAPDASVIGNVEVGARASIWYGAVVRGSGASYADGAPKPKTTVGAGANVQDHAIVEGSSLGAGAIIGHSAKLFDCTVGDSALIGMGSIVLHGATVGSHSMIAAGAVVEPGTCAYARGGSGEGALRGALMALIYSEHFLRLQLSPGRIGGWGAALFLLFSAFILILYALPLFLLQGTVVPAEQLWAGNPATFKRQLSKEQTGKLPSHGTQYEALAQEHAAILPPVATPAIAA